MQPASRSWAGRLALLLLLGLGDFAAVWAYEGKTHQQMTFLAAKQLSRCGVDVGGPPFSPLQIRTIATRNAELAEGSFFARLFRWRYYDPLARDDNAIAWVLDTRFTAHFRSLVQDLGAAADEESALESLGYLLAYLQMVSSPPRAIPVYAPRFWRGSLTDRFDHYPLREAELEAGLGADCAHLAVLPESYEALLAELAADTIQAVQRPIARLPATWEVFWTLPVESGEFGGYGPAGNNFGRYTEFPCGSGDIHRCVLITDDPAYGAFALERQLAAVRATARALLLFRDGRSATPSSAVQARGIEAEAVEAAQGQAAEARAAEAEALR